MTATLPPASSATNRLPAGAAARPASAPPRHDPDRLLATFDALADRSPHCLSRAGGAFEAAGRSQRLARYIYLGPDSDGDPLRLAVFAGIHGDEPAGTLALLQLVQTIEQHPELIRGYALFVYPVGNPTGLAAGTRENHRGLDLNRQFWRASPEPEIRFLESELWMHAFHGLITLHSDDTSPGLYGYVKGALLSSHLLEPALAAAEAHLPRDNRPVIDGWPAARGIIQEGFPGVLTAPGCPTSPPFEITLETPALAPEPLQVKALNAAVQAILTRYREFMAYAPNL